MYIQTARLCATHNNFMCWLPVAPLWLRISSHSIWLSGYDSPKSNYMYFVFGSNFHLLFTLYRVFEWLLAQNFAERLLCNKLLCVCVRQLFTFHVACCSLLQLTYTNCHLCDIFAKLLCSLLLGAKQIAPKALSGEQRRIFLSDTWRQLFDLAIFNIC